MEDKRNQEFDFNSMNFLWFLWKWKFIIMGVGLVAGIMAAIFSGPAFITPLFRSSAILLPPATNSISKALIDETSGGKQDMMSFGEEAEAEQMIQILSSSAIRDHIVSRFDLMNHYKISPRSKYAITALNKQYNSNIRISRTEHKGVEIRVMDHSPDTAMLIAQEITMYFDTLTNAIQKQRAREGMMIVEAELRQMEESIWADEDSLRKLRELGVYDYERQVEMISQQLAIELARRNQPGINALNEKLELLGKYGGPSVSIRDALEYEKKNLSELRRAYKKARIDAEANVPQKFVIDRAYRAEKKAYPIRWLIVAVSMFAATLLTIITLIVVENINRFNQVRERSNTQKG
jgi:capsule polysaccharide export protein KpsE/RkpR